MQTASLLVALGGDLGNTVPKHDCTAAEIAVLRAIHGNEAVIDIDPTGDIKRSNQDELARLRAAYGGAKDSENNSIVGQLFPGAAARVFDTIDELGIDESFFKPTARASAATPTARASAATPTARASAAKPKGKAAKQAAETAPEPEADDADDADEVEDLDAKGDNLFK